MFDRDMFDELFTKIEINDVLPLNCDHDFRIIDGSYVCVSCGIVDINRTAFYETTNKQNNKVYYIYHRKSYFREKLRLLVGIKQPSDSERFEEALKKIKEHQFDTIFDLKKIMKKLKLSIYYKYIYHVYFLIKNVKLIPLTLLEIDNLVHKFVSLERTFKKEHPDKNNLPSYDIVIATLLRKNDYTFYKYIILPKNQRKLTKIIENLLI